MGVVFYALVVIVAGVLVVLGQFDSDNPFLRNVLAPVAAFVVMIAGAVLLANMI